MFIQQIRRLLVGAVSVVGTVSVLGVVSVVSVVSAVCLSLLFGCAKDPSPEVQRVHARLLEAPNGTCVRVKLKYDPLSSRVGLIKKDPTMKHVWIILNGPNPVPIDQLLEVQEIIEPSPDNEAAWTHCVKQFALRD